MYAIHHTAAIFFFSCHPLSRPPSLISSPFVWPLCPISMVAGACWLGPLRMLIQSTYSLCIQTSLALTDRWLNVCPTPQTRARAHTHTHTHTHTLIHALGRSFREIPLSIFQEHKPTLFLATDFYCWIVLLSGCWACAYLSIIPWVIGWLRCMFTA